MTRPASRGPTPHPHSPAAPQPQAARASLGPHRSSCPSPPAPGGFSEQESCRVPAAASLPPLSPVCTEDTLPSRLHLLFFLLSSSETVGFETMLRRAWHTAALDARVTEGLSEWRGGRWSPLACEAQLRQAGNLLFQSRAQTRQQTQEQPPRETAESSTASHHNS